MPYGPAKIDIQIEQGADFILPLEVQTDAAPLDLTFAIIEASMSAQWSPGAAQIPLTIIPVDLALGLINVVFPSAESAALALPFPPRKTLNPQKFELGGWILHVGMPGDGGVITFRYCEGQVFLDRMPWLT
jgi:hypothetical protein